MINIGFDCEVVKKKERLQRKKFLPSKLAYIFGLVITLAKKPGMKAKVFIDDEELSEGEFLLSTFGNGSFCGGGFNSNPFATIRYGKVDALFVRNISRTKFVSLVGSYKTGTHIVPKNEKLLFTKKASSVLLKFPATQSISVDGEIVDCEELRIDCVKNGMRFVIPKGSKIIKDENEKESLLVGGTV
jgi:diacylglycerol kinase family enzyme